MNVFEKWLEVKKHVDYLKKEAQSSQYAYVSSSQVLGNIRGKMNELGLILLTKITGHSVRELNNTVYVSHKGDDVNTKTTTTFFTELDILYTLVNVENPAETIDFPFYGQGVDIAGEKGVGKALTYAEKYFFLKELNIPTDKDDPDSFQAKYDDKPAEVPKQQPKQNNKPAENQTAGKDLNLDTHRTYKGFMTELNESEETFCKRITLTIAAKAPQWGIEPFEVKKLADLARVDQIFLDEMAILIRAKIGQNTPQQEMSQGQQPKEGYCECGKKLSPGEIKFCKDNNVKPSCYKCRNKAG